MQSELGTFTSGPNDETSHDKVEDVRVHELAQRKDCVVVEGTEGSHEDHQTDAEEGISELVH